MYKEDTRVKITRNVAENTVWHSTDPDEGLIQTPIQEIRALVIIGLDQTPLGCNNIIDILTDMDMKGMITKTVVFY